VPADTLESAMIDGASRWERIRHVIIPHLAPLATFVALVQLMDNFRVFEPIVGFSAEANATSLSWLVFNDLVSARHAAIRVGRRHVDADHHRRRDPALGAGADPHLARLQPEGRKMNAMHTGCRRISGLPSRQPSSRSG
jgi:hypothetical protein